VLALPKEHLLQEVARLAEVGALFDQSLELHSGKVRALRVQVLEDFAQPAPVRLLDLLKWAGRFQGRAGLGIREHRIGLLDAVELLGVSLGGKLAEQGKVSALEVFLAHLPGDPQDLIGIVAEGQLTHEFARPAPRPPLGG
jgi:hypothetical protein